MQGKIHSIETFGTVDGPGIRYVVFMQGCPLRCAYCHNPDTWNMASGNEISVDELVEDISKYTRYIDGVTLSGGEPLMQIEFVTELFEKVKSLGLTTCIDTSGIVFDKDNLEFMGKLNKLIKFCDLVMLDIKHIDSEKHKSLTGKENIAVLQFAKYLDELNVDMWLRYVLVPDINDDDESLHKWRAFADTLDNVKKIELLPYHRLGIKKYEELNISYRLKETLEPDEKSITNAKKILRIEQGE